MNHKKNFGKEIVMDNKIKEKFIGLWEKYFPGAEVPIIFYYTDEEREGEFVSSPIGHCVVGNLQTVRNGKALRFGAESIGCFGGKRYLGYPTEMMPNFEYFLSCGIPGKMEGERYLKTPELVKKRLMKMAKFTAPKKFIVFKRWDMLEENEEPDVVIFFATPDVLAGLYTLANFDEEEQGGIITPFGAGCGTIVQYPYLEIFSERPKCIIGLFDLSARPFVKPNELTFSVPMKKFIRMIDNIEESFLITDTWNKIKERIKNRY